ncbi:hypothetical protein GGI25_001365 [Coemansia spiralis]|uniref:Uncharacterized protein n=2 Tax=Coemansia TaxID=4863 RepID=A0A9W8L070_9FUNG|nr:hypothetical protein EDC05_001229 [Coemansia umbellata]KAJ2624067.1 hypothetical protein GGI26_001860 [Coemansia sp. RSA 1358]KAJ2679675.1 hypothetical protein GGI25_001365 [Coemansia spiralis]
MISSSATASSIHLRAARASRQLRPIYLCLLSRSAPPASSAMVARRFYSPQTSTIRSAKADLNSEKRVSPQDLLDKKTPTAEKEILSSMVDGELDYDTDMGAAAVNNIEAKRRAEAAEKAERITRETMDEINKHRRP